MILSVILIILLFNIVYFNKGINNVCIRSISSIDYVELNWDILRYELLGWWMYSFFVYFCLYDRKF